MFRSYYGLSFNPFDKQMAREKDRFLSKDISEMLSRLDYLKDTRGIGLFTARPGMGKSFAPRCFAKGLNPNLCHMEYICLSTVSVMEFYRQLCSVLGGGAQGRKARHVPRYTGTDPLSLPGQEAASSPGR